MYKNSCKKKDNNNQYQDSILDGEQHLFIDLLFTYFLPAVCGGLVLMSSVIYFILLI